MSISRRNFLKTVGIGGCVTLLSKSVTIKTAKASVTNKFSPNPLLKGVSDIHIHAAPDTQNRLIDELSFAKDAKDVGYRSIMYKSNDWSCHDRVYLIRQAMPDFEVFGSLCMNDVHGDKVNVVAAEKAVKTTGNFCRCIWMPTGSAAYQHQQYKLPTKGTPVVDNRGKVLPEVVRVMEICRDANIIFATGHCSPEESLIMAKKAQEVGVKKFVVTHVNSLIWKMTHDQIKKVIDLGAFVEYCYITNLWGSGTGLSQFPRMSSEEFVDFAKINPERSFISTDLGQVKMPHPIEGMLDCIKTLQKAEISQKDIDLLVRSNPAKLMGL